MTIEEQAVARTYPPFSLYGLIEGTFKPLPGQRLGLLIDLADPHEVIDFRFLSNPELTIQRHAYLDFYCGLHEGGVLAQLQLTGGDFFAYQVTGGSNLDLPDLVVASDGRELSFERDIYPHYDILLCISTYSATAPLTATAKRFGFRGATLHGLNSRILETGLAVDYDQVSHLGEQLRLGLTRADWVEMDFECLGNKSTLHLDLGRQEAQKSHGLCRGTEPDVANLPAGEIYYVPTNASGEFPMKYEDGTLGLQHVAEGRVTRAVFLSGDAETIAAHNHKLAGDPITGEIGELGFGTQILPVSGRDIQDEKILGTIHVATGRSDHLGGHITPDKFVHAANATHDDILFAPHKTPEIKLLEARMLRDGKQEILIQNYQPSRYLTALIE